MATAMVMQVRSMAAAAMAAAVAVAAAGCGGDDDGDASGADAGGESADAGPDDPRWEALADLPSGPVQETAVVVLDEKLHVIGGIHGDRGTVADVLIYDPAGDDWSEGVPLPMAVHHANAAVVDGRIVVAGALQANFAPVASVWSWAPGEEAWAEGAPMPGGLVRGASAVGAAGGRVIVAGGLGPGSIDTVLAYDPAQDEWDTELPPLPARLDHGTGQVVDGVLYVIGGRTDGIGEVTGAVYALDLEAGAWEERAPMPTPRGGIGSGVVDGTIIVVGGEGNPAPGSRGVYPQAERYDPAADAWSALPDMRTPRHGTGAAGIGGALYVPGGADQQAFGSVATHEVLRLP